MSVERCRRFTLSDAMILVVATAVGCGLIKWSGTDVVRLFDPDPRYKQSSFGGYLSSFVGGTHYTVVPFLASWSPAMVLIRMRTPRPSRRRLFRQPGVVATSAATLAVAAELFWFFASNFSGSGNNMRIFVAFAGWRAYCAFSVAGAWLTLSLSGRWRGETGWIDRIGSVLGFGWIACLLIYWLQHNFLRL